MRAHWQQQEKMDRSKLGLVEERTALVLSQEVNRFTLLYGLLKTIQFCTAVIKNL